MVSYRWARCSTLLAALTATLLCLAAEGDGMTGFKLSSPAYPDKGAMDARFTCQGDDTSPPLSWSGAPAGTKSYTLIIDDPDAPDPAAPQMTWVHWVVYDIPAGTTALSEGAAKHMPAGSRDGLNDWKHPGYGGPCPPIGRHRYVHKLYALDTVLPDLKRPDKVALEAAMHGHVLAETQLIGTYQKK